MVAERPGQLGLQVCKPFLGSTSSQMSEYATNRDLEKCTIWTCATLRGLKQVGVTPMYAFGAFELDPRSHELRRSTTIV